MGRFCNGLLTAFRVVQFLFSLTVLGCGAYIVYVMYSMSSSAHDIEETIDLLVNGTTWQSIGDSLKLDIDTDDIETFSTVLNHTLIPVLHFLEGTPLRAILVAVAGLWSTSIIIYLHMANKKKTTNPSANRRWIRVTLELLTLLIWLIGIICAVLLSLEFGVVALAGGAETKLAFNMLKPLLKELLEKLVKSDNALRSLSIVDDIVTIGIMAILTTVAACVCWLVAMVSLIVACCTSGKAKVKDGEKGEAATPFVPAKSAGYSVVAMESPSPSLVSVGAPTPVMRQYDDGYGYAGAQAWNGGQRYAGGYGYHAV